MATKRNFWLMKTEPDVYSIDDLAREGQAFWEGVRNYQARNHMRSMALSDLALFYHSNAKPPGVVGVARVCKLAYTDHTQFDKRSKYFGARSRPSDPRWSMVDVEFVEKLPEPVSLEMLKTDAKLSTMLVTKRGIRLSVQPVDRAHFARVLKLGKARTKL